MTEPAASLLDSLPDAALSSSSQAPARGIFARLAFPVAYVAIAAVLAAVSLSIVRVNHGTFLYTLDDPYIHLALSDQIRHGNYGLYAGTHAAPSSSILFPFILALASGTALHPYFPLFINICALFFTLEVMRRFLRHLKLGNDDFTVIVEALAVFLAAVCFNLVGVVYTGLEHSLHIATVAATVYGLALFLDLGELPSWLPLVLVLSPLLRYEGLALSCGALLILALRGRVRIAIATFGVIAVFIVGFSVFLKGLGLAALPSSILSKSGVAAGSMHQGSFHAFHELVQAVVVMTNHAIGLPILLVGAACAVRLAQILIRGPRVWTPDNSMVIALFCLIGGHTVAGRFGWLNRYEDYLVLGTVLIVIYLAQSAIRDRFTPARRDLLVVAGSVIAMLFLGQSYWHSTFISSKASDDIYEQQYQMHRFVDGYWRGPVAVNDLGLVSYRNPYPVLDLGGLGSEKARLLAANHADAATYEKFVAESGVHLAIVYEEWFAGQIPETWQKVGTLYLPRIPFAAGYANVQFFATDAATAATVRAELTAFQSTLPSEVILKVY